MRLKWTTLEDDDDYVEAARGSHAPRVWWFVRLMRVESYVGEAEHLEIGFDYWLDVSLVDLDQIPADTVESARETTPAETPTPTTPATQPPAASASNDVQSAGRSPRALDPRNIEIVTARLAARRGSDKGKPRVGDLIRYATGETRRVSYVWDDGVQPGDGSYHLTRSGHCSMSGGLDPNVPFAALTDTGLFEHAAVWIFDLDWSGAGRGVDFRIPFRVWAVDPSVESYDAHLRSLGIRAWKGEP